MTDPLDGLPPFPVPSADRNFSSNDDDDAATASNIPISDFRRNEMRPIVNDNGEPAGAPFPFPFALSTRPAQVHLPSAEPDQVPPDGPTQEAAPSLARVRRVHRWNVEIDYQHRNDGIVRDW